MSLYLMRHLSCMYTCPPRTTACRGRDITAAVSANCTMVTARVFCNSENSNSCVSEHRCFARQAATKSVDFAGRNVVPHASFWMDGSVHGRLCICDIYNAVVLSVSCSSSDTFAIVKSDCATHTGSS